MARKPWTDEEYGFVQDSTWPVWRIAKELDRTESSIHGIRKKFKSGWSPTREGFTPWSTEDADYVRTNPQLSNDQLASDLGRTKTAVTFYRRRLLGTSRSTAPIPTGAASPYANVNISPYQPGARPLLAQTCPQCGLLLQAKWFQGSTRGRLRTCKRCYAAERQERGKVRVHCAKDEAAHRRDSKQYQHMQRITLERATNHRQPWVEADSVTLADPDLTLLQKALLLRRTYASTAAAARKHGFTSRVGLGDPERDQWIIDNPNAKEYAA